MTNTEVQNKTKETVLAFITALNNEDFDAARRCLADDLTFIGVMGTRHGADIYIKEMKQMKFKYLVKKVFSDENDVCLYYDIDMGKAKIFASGWYQLKDNLIHTFNVLFDPRPLLENKSN